MISETLTSYIFLGERALRDIIKQARQVGVLANDPKIKQLCDELDNLIDRISALRAKGLVSKLDLSFNAHRMIVLFFYELFFVVFTYTSCV